jgi:hypothetical protein
MTRWSEHDYKVFLAGRKVDTPKPSKYRNQKVEVDGLTFDSKREAARWRELQLEERAGHISNLRRQVPFALTVNRVHVADYRADFTYVRAGREVVEDYKGCRTEVYRLKRKLMLAVYGIEILES